MTTEKRESGEKGNADSQPSKYQRRTMSGHDGLSLLKYGNNTVGPRRGIERTVNNWKRRDPHSDKRRLGKLE